MAITISISAPSSAEVGVNFQVSGYVRDDGESLSEAVVSIYVNNNYVTGTTTDTRGYYSKNISISEIGVYTLKATAVGASATRSIIIAYIPYVNSVTIDAPSNVQTGQSFTISGQVKDQYGNGYGGVMVNLYRDLSPFSSIFADSSGYYSTSTSIRTAGTYTLKAMSSGIWSPDRTITIEAVAAPFIEVSTPATAIRGETFLVSGRVYESTTGEPYPGTTVGCHYDGAAFGSDVTDINGRFEISGSIPTVGTYTIRPNAKGVIGSTTITIQEYVTPTPPPTPPPEAALSEVRFACIPGVAGVKCTLDGAVKYSDETGICRFFNISRGAHSYSIVAPEGWSYVSGDDGFGRPLYESGTTVIEWVPYPEIPWPADQPWMMKFVFEEVTVPLPPVIPPTPPPGAPVVTVTLQAIPNTQLYDQPISFSGNVSVDGIPETGLTVEIRDASTNMLITVTETDDTGYYYVEWTPTYDSIGSFNVWAVATINPVYYSGPVTITVTEVVVPPAPVAPPILPPMVPPILPPETKYIEDRFEALYYVLWDIKEEIRPITIKANAYRIRSINLSIARPAFDTFYTPGFALTVLKCTGTMDMIIGDKATDSITIEPILYPQMVVIDRMDFDMFFVKNSAQPGKEATVIVWRRL